jgi:MATE family multidrug resistance protein
MTLETGSSAASASGGWWSRPSGGREVLRVAAPLVVSSLSWTIMTFVDRAMLSRMSLQAMDAAFTSSLAWFAILALPLGICSYANTFVAQYDGAGRSERVGLAMWQAVWIAIALGAGFLLLIPLAPALFSLEKQTPEVYGYEVQYFQILTCCAPAMLIEQAAKSFYSGRGQTWVVMLVDAGAALLNLVLDYAWIFGYYGFPEWGVAGAAWATVVASWVKTIIYLLLPLQQKHRARFGTIAGIRWDAELARRIVYFGWPSGCQMLLDVMGFTVFIFAMGALGEVPKQATSLAFSVSSLAFMPIFGLHIAVSVLVGERLGESRDDLAARATITTLHIAWIYMAIISMLYAFVPQFFLMGFIPESSGAVAGNAAVHDLAKTLLLFVAAYNLFDATQMILVGALKGAGDTQFLLRVSLVLALLLGGISQLGVKLLKLNVYQCWVLIVLWCLLAAATYVVRYRQGKWRAMRVIEMGGDAELA